MIRCISSCEQLTCCPLECPQGPRGRRGHRGHRGRTGSTGATGATGPGTLVDGTIPSMPQ